MMLATKVQEGLGSSSVDANVSQMMPGLVTYLCILRSIPHPKRTPSLLSATGNCISLSPLPTGLASERHWGKAEGGLIKQFFSTKMGEFYGKRNSF